VNDNSLFEIGQLHGLRFISETSKPYELYKNIEMFLVKGHSINDKARNNVYKFKKFTMVLSLASGRLTIYTNNVDWLDELEGKLTYSLFIEIKENLKPFREEFRIPDRSLHTKRNYLDVQISQITMNYRSEVSTPPLAHSNFANNKIVLNSIFMAILDYIYNSGDSGISVPYYVKVTGSNYYQIKRYCEKLFEIGLVEKIGKSPASYLILKDRYKANLISIFVNIWKNLFSIG
jgi:hypothetical protein